MTDDWLREIDDKEIVGTVLLDFSAAFDIIDHSLLLEKRNCYGFTPPDVFWIKSYLSNRKQMVFFNFLGLGVLLAEQLLVKLEGAQFT